LKHESFRNDLQAPAALSYVSDCVKTRYFSLRILLRFPLLWCYSSKRWRGVNGETCSAQCKL